MSLQIGNELKNEISELELKLDVFNIVMMRQKAQFELERLGKMQEGQAKKSWFKGWFSKSETTEEKSSSADISKTFANFLSVILRSHRRCLHVVLTNF